MRLTHLSVASVSPPAHISRDHDLRRLSYSGCKHVGEHREHVGIYSGIYYEELKAVTHGLYAYLREVVGDGLASGGKANMQQTAELRFRERFEAGSRDSSLAEVLTEEQRNDHNAYNSGETTGYCRSRNA